MFASRPVAHKVPSRYSRRSISTHLCQNQAPFHFGFHFWISQGWLGKRSLNTPDGQFQNTLMKIGHRSLWDSFSGSVREAWNYPFGILSEHIPSYPSKSRNRLQTGAVPDLDQCDLELTIWNIERALSNLPNQFQTDYC